MPIVTSREQFLRFIYRFFGFFAVFMLVAVLLPDSFNVWFAELWAKLVGAILSVSGATVRVTGDLVSYNGFRVVIIPECTGLIAMLLFTAFVCAFPSSPKGKGVGLLYGLPILAAFNAFRLALLLVIGDRWPDAFEYVHIFIAQMLFIMLVFVLCLVWLRRYSASRSETIGHSFPLKALGVACLCFLVWMFTNEWYVAATELAARFLTGSLAGYDGAYRYGPFFDPKTFNVVTFSTLVLITTAAPLKKRGRTLLFGIAVLAANAVLLKTLEMHNAQHHTYLGIRAAIFVNFLGQLFLPLTLWFRLAYPYIFKKKGVFTCPICGEEKVGLREHIIAKHGEEALKAPGVREALGDG